MDSDSQSKEEMLQLCTEFYRANPIELRKIEEFRHTHPPENAINWYTAECFRYKHLNKVLRSEDFKLLYTFRFFIIDLSNALTRQRNHSKDGDLVSLYLGQQLSTDEIKKFRENIGVTVAMHGFLSTSRGKDVAIAYAEKPSDSGHQVSVLFEISANPYQPSIIFADIANQSRVEDEQEVLFNLNMLFKITSVDFEPSLQRWTIRLTTVDDDLERAKIYLETLQNQMIGYSPMIIFGRILLVELGQTERAMDYFHLLLQTLPPNHPDSPAIYNGLGHVYYAKHDFDEALKNFLIAYDMRQKSLPPDHPHIAGSLANIGNIYREKNDFDRALEYYSKAAAIDEQYYSGDDMKKARSLRNVACMHWKKHELDAALEILNSALAMYNRLISAEHPEVFECLQDIAPVYDQKGDFAIALAYHERQLKIGDV